MSTSGCKSCKSRIIEVPVRPTRYIAPRPIQNPPPVQYAGISPSEPSYKSSASSIPPFIPSSVPSSKPVRPHIEKTFVSSPPHIPSSTPPKNTYSYQTPSNNDQKYNYKK